MAETKTEVATKTATTSRAIRIVTTRGEKVKIEFNGTKWSELRSIIQKGGKDVDGKPYSGFDLSNMKAVEGVKKNTLEHDDAVIPDGDFNLFLMPYKSKSGALSRTDAYAKIKGFIAKNSENAKAHFSDGGKNYTQINTEKLNELIESYEPGTAKAVGKEKASAISDVVSSVKKAKASGNEEDILANLGSLGFEEKIDLVIALLLDIKVSGGQGTSESVEETTQQPSAPVESEDDKKKRLQEEEDEKNRKVEEERKKEEKRKQDEQDEKELAEMMGGLKDVARK